MIRQQVFLALRHMQSWLFIIIWEKLIIKIICKIFIINGYVNLTKVSMFIYPVLYLTFIISYINEGLKFDEQGNKQKALQFYHKGMQMKPSQKSLAHLTCTCI